MSWTISCVDFSTANWDINWLQHSDYIGLSLHYSAWNICCMETEKLCVIGKTLPYIASVAIRTIPNTFTLSPLIRLLPPSGIQYKQQLLHRNMHNVPTMYTIVHKS